MHNPVRCGLTYCPECWMKMDRIHEDLQLELYHWRVIAQKRRLENWFAPDAKKRKLNISDINNINE